VVDARATLVLVDSGSGESSASSKGRKEGSEGLHFVVGLNETSVLVTNEWTERWNMLEEAVVGSFAS
jgi:hypothetical protein